MKLTRWLVSLAVTCLLIPHYAGAATVLEETGFIFGLGGENFSFVADQRPLVYKVTLADLEFPGAWLDLGMHQQIHLLELSSPDKGRRHPAHGGRDHHVALDVHDLDALISALENAGIAYTLSRSGRRALFCRDPDGNAIELVEQPDGAAVNGS